VNRSLRFVRWHCRIIVGVCSAILVLAYVWEFSSSANVRSGAGGSIIRRLGRRGPAVHVVIGSDDTDLRPAAVAMKSAIQASARPGRLMFHFITTAEFMPLFQELLATHIPEANVEVHQDERVQRKIEQSVGFRARSEGLGNRQIANAFEFAPFYVSQYLNKRQRKDPVIRRVVYIETDSVILGDLAEIYDMNLKGAPVAAVKRCQQRYSDYINMNAMNELGNPNLNPGTCIADRSVMVIDLVRWDELDITGQIESWMERYRNSKTELWYGKPISVVPWLLAMNGNYHDLGKDWGCRGLAGESMSLKDSKGLRKNGFDHVALKQLGVDHSEYGSIAPYISICSQMSSVLSFDGPLPPWREDSFGKRRSLCAVPDSFADASWSWKVDVKIFCEGTRFVNCGDIWWSYMSHDTSCALKDFDKEWRDDEQTWTSRKYQIDAKAERDNREASRLEREERELERRDQEERERREVEETIAQEALNKKKAKRKELEDRIKIDEKAEKSRQKADAALMEEEGKDAGDVDDDELSDGKEEDPDFIEEQPYENLDIF